MPAAVRTVTSNGLSGVSRFIPTKAFQRRVFRQPISEVGGTPRPSLYVYGALNASSRHGCRSRHTPASPIDSPVLGQWQSPRTRLQPLVEDSAWQGLSHERGGRTGGLVVRRALHPSARWR